MTKKGSNNKDRKKKVEKNMEEEEKQADTPVVSEELVRWMTEGTSPNNTPRSDCC